MTDIFSLCLLFVQFLCNIAFFSVSSPFWSLLLVPFSGPSVHVGLRGMFGAALLHCSPFIFLGSFLFSDTWSDIVPILPPDIVFVWRTGFVIWYCLCCDLMLPLCLTVV